MIKQQGLFLFSQKPLSWAAYYPESKTCCIYFCMIILVVYSGRVNLIHVNPSFRNNSLFPVLSHLFACGYENVAFLCLVQLFCFFKDILKYDFYFEAFFASSRNVFIPLLYPHKYFWCCLILPISWFELWGQKLVIFILASFLLPRLVLYMAPREP